MIKKLVICMTVFVLAAGMLMAHGDPLLGTVTAITKDVLTIVDKDKKEVKIMLDSKTKYMLGTKAAKMADIKVGEKVSVDAMMDAKMKMYVAEEVTGTAPVVKTATKTTTTTKSTTTTTSTTPAKTPATK